MKTTLQKARDLRKRQTPQEKRLWAFLRETYGKRFAGLKFKRQVPIDYYIVDFCCFEKRLVIEVDGSVHDKEEQKIYDKERDDYLSDQGFKVLRFSNSEIDDTIEEVVHKIATALRVPSPPAGEGLGNRGHPGGRGVSLLIFDLDGTLIDSRRDIANSVHWTLRQLNLPQISDEVIYSFVGNGVRPLIQQSVGEEQGPNFQQALKIFKEHYQVHLLDHTVLFDGVREVLEYFSPKKRAVFTNKPQYFTEPILKGLKLDPYFDAVIGSDAGYPKKPDPTVIHHLLKQFDCSPNQAILIGDSKVDIETGKNAGILTCGVTYGFRPEEEVRAAGPDFVINDLLTLKSLLR